MSLELPNFTLAIQFMLFFGAFLVLNQFIFVPLLKVIEERRKKTIETFKNSEDLSQKAIALSQEYEGKLKDYRGDLKQKVESARQDLLKKQAQILDEKKAELSQGIKRHRAIVQQQIAVAEKELVKDIEEISLDIARKFGV